MQYFFEKLLEILSWSKLTLGSEVSNARPIGGLNKLSIKRKKHKKDVWYKNKNLSYNEILEWDLQVDLFEDDFNECDSGFCSY